MDDVFNDNTLELEEGDAVEEDLDDDMDDDDEEDDTFKATDEEEM